MIPRFSPSLDWRDIVAGVGNLSLQGDAVADFEAAFAERARQKHAIAFPYGRTGLAFLLRALGLRDREVICPAYTCVVVANAIVRSGNRCVFVDASADDANMNFGAAEQAISDRTGAIVSTSIYGHPVDVDRLDALRSRHAGLPVIQDCAHSFFSDWNGRPVHREGVAALFAFNISKLSTSVFGGMVTTDDGDLAHRLRALRNAELTRTSTLKAVMRFLYSVAAVAAFSPAFYGLTLGLQRARLLDRFTKYYDDDRIDMPADWRDRMSGYEARVGVSNLARLDDRISARRRYAEHYRNRLKGHPAIRFFSLSGEADASFSHCAALVADPRQVREACRRNGVELGELIEYVVPLMQAHGSSAGKNADFPVSQAISSHVVNLPVASRFARNRADRVVEVLQRVLADKPAAPLLRGPA